jgi:WD40 repeat protein
VLFDYRDGKPLSRLPDDGRGTVCSAFSRDGGKVATAGNEVTVWDVPSGRKIRVLRRPPALGRYAIEGLTLTPNGSHVVASLYHTRYDAIDPGRIVVWPIDGAADAVVVPINHSPAPLAFLPGTDSTFLTVTLDGRLGIWDFAALLRRFAPESMGGDGR